MIVRIQTGARLHFGLTSFGNRDDNDKSHRYGGAGVMIDQPGIDICFKPSPAFQIDWKDEPLTNRSHRIDIERRMTDLAKRWHEWSQSFDHDPTSNSLPNCEIEIREILPQHSGFGSGTQLSLAIVAGLSSLFELPFPDFRSMVQFTGRGNRSLVGSYGFALGGFVVDEVDSASEPGDASVCHIPIPPEWRFVVVCPESPKGLSGKNEFDAFNGLPQVSSTLVDQLQHILDDQMIPSIRGGEFDDFSRSMWEFGRMSGSCFANAQGGQFNGEAIESTISKIRSLGFEGVGQSSWGPATMTVTPNQSSAESLAEELQRNSSPSIQAMWIAKPRNQSATIQKQGVETQLPVTTPCLSRA